MHRRGKGKGRPSIGTLTPALSTERKEAWPHDLIPGLSLPE